VKKIVYRGFKTLIIHFLMKNTSTIKGDITPRFCYFQHLHYAEKTKETTNNMPAASILSSKGLLEFNYNTQRKIT